MLLTTNQDPIRLALADSHTIFKEGFKALLHQQQVQMVQLVAEARTGGELLQSIEWAKPHVIITDINLPELGGIEICRLINQHYPHINVIVLSSYQEENALVNAFCSGVKGYLLKDSDGDEFLEAVHTVYYGGHYLCKNTSKKLNSFLGSINKKLIPKNNNTAFSAKELLIIKKICQQFTSKEIATELHLTPRTVEDYRKKIQEKMGARNMVGIGIYALKNNLVKISEL